MKRSIFIFSTGLFFLVLSYLLVGCIPTTSPSVLETPTPTPVPIARMEIAPKYGIGTPGGTVAFTIRLFDENGNPVEGDVVFLSVRDTVLNNLLDKKEFHVGKEGERVTVPIPSVVPSALELKFQVKGNPSVVGGYFLRIQNPQEEKPEPYKIVIIPSFTVVNADYPVNVRLSAWVYDKDGNKIPAIVHWHGIALETKISETTGKEAAKNIFYTAGLPAGSYDVTASTDTGENTSISTNAIIVIRRHGSGGGDGGGTGDGGGGDEGGEEGEPGKYVIIESGEEIEIKTENGETLTETWYTGKAVGKDGKVEIPVRVIPLSYTSQQGNILWPIEITVRLKNKYVTDTFFPKQFPPKIISNTFGLPNDYIDSEDYDAPKDWGELYKSFDPPISNTPISFTFSGNYPDVYGYYIEAEYWYENSLTKTARSEEFGIDTKGPLLVKAEYDPNSNEIEFTFFDMGTGGWKTSVDCGEYSWCDQYSSLSDTYNCSLSATRSGGPQDIVDLWLGSDGWGNGEEMPYYNESYTPTCTVSATWGPCNDPNIPPIPSWMGGFFKLNEEVDSCSQFASGEYNSILTHTYRASLDPEYGPGMLWDTANNEAMPTTEKPANEWGAPPDNNGDGYPDGTLPILTSTY